MRISQAGRLASRGYLVPEEDRDARSVLTKDDLCGAGWLFAVSRSTVTVIVVCEPHSALSTAFTTKVPRTLEPTGEGSALG
jgi:hypothetical protein